MLTSNSEKEPESRARLTCAIDLKPREVEWLWSGRVPLGMITMFAGDPKLGKSFVTLAMAAALSRGLPLPMSDLPNQPGSTILMSAEDDPNGTIVPRLEAAGADLTKVHILESIILANGSETFPSLRADVNAITAAAVRLGDCRLIVIDPVSAYLEGIDDHRNAALRGVLTPLKTLAERLGAAVVLVSHATKGGSGNGKHQTRFDRLCWGSSCANHFFIADPQDPTGRRVLMLDNGGNVVAPARTLASWVADRGNGSRVDWSDEPVAMTTRKLLRPKAAHFLGGKRTDERRLGRRLASCFSGRRSQDHDRDLQSRRRRGLFQEPDQTCQVPDQRGCQEKRLWRHRTMELETGRPLDLTMIASKVPKVSNIAAPPSRLRSSLNWCVLCAARPCTAKTRHKRRFSRGERNTRLTSRNPFEPRTVLTAFGGVEPRRRLTDQPTGRCHLQSSPQVALPRLASKVYMIRACKL